METPAKYEADNVNQPAHYRAGDIECIDAGIAAALAAPAEPSGNSGEFAAPAGEQVGLTEAEMVEAVLPLCQNRTTAEMLVKASRDDYRAIIAAHEAKRVSCSQTAKKSTHEVGRVDENGKSEHVGGGIYDVSSGGAA